MNIEDTLLAYSEWIDGQGIVRGEEESKDDRDHGTLVKDFITYWTTSDAPCTQRAPLPVDISTLAETIHGISTGKGFTPPDMENLPTKLMLSVSELSEAMEEHRKERGLLYYQCELCGTKGHTPEEEDEGHYVAGSKVVDAIYRFFNLKPRKVPCPGKIAKPEGILPELADSVIRNLHMMHSLTKGDVHDGQKPGVVIVEKVEFNAGRPLMHGGNIY